MRRKLESTLRFFTFGILSCSIAWLCTWTLTGQEKTASSKKDAPKARTDNQQFSLPDQRDAREQLKAVLDYLERKTIPWDVVTGTSQRLLDAPSDSFYRLKDAKGNETGAVVSVKAKVNEILAGLPKEGRQFYEQEYGSPAAELLKKAIDNNNDRNTLNELSQRYFHTRAGGQATLLMGAVDLEAGDLAGAAYAYSRLLSRPDSAEYLTPRVTVRAAFALRRSGSDREIELANTLWAKLEKNFPREGIAIGRRTYTLEELQKEYDRKLAQSGTQAEGVFSQRYGNPAHTALSEGGTPFLDPAFPPKPMLFRGEPSWKFGAGWVEQNLESTFKKLDVSKREVAIPGFFPISVPGALIFRTYNGITAIASRDGVMWGGKARTAGETLWYSSPDLIHGSAQKLSKEDKGTALEWWKSWATSNPRVLFESTHTGSISHDGKYLYVVDDLAIPPPPVVVNPNMGFPGQPQPSIAGSQQGMMASYNRLMAFNIETGLLAWIVGGFENAPMKEEEEAKSTNTQLLLENSFFLGPPISVHGKLYALYERKNQIRLGCFEPNKIILSPATKDNPVTYRYPELLWSQVLGDSATTLKTDSLRRVQSAYLAHSNGIIVCPTNCGAIVAVDINSRSLRWARYYGSAPDPRATAGSGIGQPRVNFNPNGIPIPTIPTDRWRASAPIIVNDKLIVSAYDSNQLQCFDLRSGDLLWTTDREQNDLYVAGVYANSVVIVGKRSVRAYSIDGKGDPQSPWEKIPIGTPVGHGTISKEGLLYVPVVGTAEKADASEPQITAIDLKTGKVRANTSFRRKFESNIDTRQLLGNLLFHDGMLFSQSSIELTAFPLIELKRREMAERLKNNPNDPEGLFARGELSLDNGDIREAIRDFKAVESAKPNAVLEGKLRQKLYLAYTEVLRNKFEDGDPLLEEYEKLCDISVESDDPAEKVRLHDERLRRRALYLTLVAKGREKQGRYIEAFELYRTFAKLGDNKQLVNIHDEPNGQTRPDVWARGRIESMMKNAKDDGARKQLQNRMQAEWAALKDQPDLAKLREFVKVFGPFFDVGEEAQLLLADRLLETKLDDDQREAQTMLMQLWASASGDISAARAVEKLARMMLRRGQMEDAVGMFAQLGNRYATVKIRDGKTGADIFAELITDKRLSPFLDPGQIRQMEKYKVESSSNPNNAVGGPAQGFSLFPEGEFFPFYRRFQFSLEMSGSNDGLWLLRVTDRNTGEERCKFTGLAGIQIQYSYSPNQQSFSGAKIAVASGQYMIVNLGQYVYCFDLAEKREVWRQNMLGKSTSQTPPQVSMNDDEMVFMFDDGWTYKLSRSLILHQNYCAMMTRDGLKVLDPATGQEVWTRTNVSPKSQIFGDEKHIFIYVPNNENPGKVLRVSDGTVVDGLPDFNVNLQDNPTFTSFGRMMFLRKKTSGVYTLRLHDPVSGKDVWLKEYKTKTEPMKTIDPTITGMLSEDGQFEVLEIMTGKILAKGMLEEAFQVGNFKTESGGLLVKNPLLLMDSARVYIVLNRNIENKRTVYYSSNQVLLRRQNVSGAVIAFDRTSGKRLWYNTDVLVGQQLILDRFEEVPILMAGTTIHDPLTGMSSYKVVALDKRNGRLMHQYSYTGNGMEFGRITQDLKTKAIEFSRFHDGLRLKVIPVE
ncbi:MAG: PQQ-binding-like beta-propeller repeat protein [Fimbriiglobus sp.]